MPELNESIPYRLQGCFDLAQNIRWLGLDRRIGRRRALLAHAVEEMVNAGFQLCAQVAQGDIRALSGKGGNEWTFRVALGVRF